MRYCMMLVAFIFVMLNKLWAHGAHHDHDHAHGEEGFHWTKEKTEFANIQVEVAGPGTIQNFIQVAGKIHTHPDFIAYVIPKLSGSVFEVKKNIGDSVEKDEIIAILESQEVSSLIANYLAAQKKYHAQQAIWAKEKLLRGISPLQDLLNAEVAAEEAAIQLKVATQNLYTLGFSQQEIAKLDKDPPSHLRFYALKSPLKGIVVQRMATLGEVIDTSTRAFTIVNFDTVAADISVPQGDVVYIKDALPVKITSVSGKTVQAKLTQFNPTIDEETRAATAVALIDNQSKVWSPGEFVTAHIQTDITPVSIIVPVTAIQMIKGEKCIFVQEGEEFVPHAVKLGKMDELHVEIVSGLSQGVRFAAYNTFCLKADYEKEEAEHHH